MFYARLCNVYNVSKGPAIVHLISYFASQRQMNAHACVRIQYVWMNKELFCIKKKRWCNKFSILIKTEIHCNEPFFFVLLKIYSLHIFAFGHSASLENVPAIGSLLLLFETTSIHISCFYHFESIEVKNNLQHQRMLQNKTVGNGIDMRRSYVYFNYCKMV